MSVGNFIIQTLDGLMKSTIVKRKEGNECFITSQVVQLYLPNPNFLLTLKKSL